MSDCTFLLKNYLQVWSLCLFNEGNNKNECQEQPFRKRQREGTANDLRGLEEKGGGRQLVLSIWSSFHVKACIRVCW